ncbi:MAG: NAD-dependent epimerase/dehydratase family protein, partial [bacterium]|nr:NAD-dependent epimerase/dehydratase family protein [bacterium]
LSHKIDCLINSAAYVKHYGHYENFRQVNVEGVKGLLDFALTGKKKDFNHISTVSVASAANRKKRLNIFRECDTAIDSPTGNLYIETKVEAEKLVLEARQKGIHANIMRVGNLIFHSQTGKFQENIEDNAFYSQLKAFIKIGALPDLKFEQLEFSFIEYTAEAVCLLFSREKLRNETYHLRNPNHISYAQLAQYIRKSETGIQLNPLPALEILDFLMDNYENKSISRYIEHLILHSGIGGKQEDGFLKVVSGKSDGLLEKLGFHWPHLSGKHVKKMLLHCKDVNFL